MKRFRRITLTLLVIAAAVYGGLLVFGRRGGERAAPTLVERVQLGSFSRDVTGSGVVEAERARDLSFPTSGTVAEILVREGDPVTAGQLLARLDTATVERDLASSRSSLASARAERQRTVAQQRVDRLDIEGQVAAALDGVANAEQRLRDASNDLATQERLAGIGAASGNTVATARDALAAAERQLGQARLTLESSRTRRTSFDQLASAQVASADAQIAQLQTTIGNLEARLTDARLVAPFDGVVSDVAVEIGDVVAQGPAISVVDLSALRVDATFDESRAAAIRSGQPAVVEPDAAPELTIPMVVERVDPVADRSDSAAEVGATLRFVDDEDATAVRPGFTVTSRVTVAALDEALLVPLEAISEGDDGRFVYRVVPGEEPGSGVVHRTTVNVLDRNATVAAVAPGESLSAGDRIAVIDLETLEDGAAVSWPTDEATP